MSSLGRPGNEDVPAALEHRSSTGTYAIFLCVDLLAFAVCGVRQERCIGFQDGFVFFKRTHSEKS